MGSEERQQVSRKRRPWVWAIVAGLLLLLLATLAPWPNCCLPVTTKPPGRTWAMVHHFLSVGLEAFKADWGVYPPSSPRDGGAKDHGYQNLAYYLMGPTGEGWGAPVAGELPFGSKDEHSYGPYFCYERAKETDSVLDAFRPPKPILYYRFEVGRKPHYEVRDNPIDPACKMGFASREHFELSARYHDADGKRRWQREDYLLISPGRDRLYGHVVEDEKTGGCRAATHRPATQEDIEAGRAVYDDVTNFD